MQIEVEGDHKIAQEVIQHIYQWDKAIVENNIDALMQKCTTGFNLFDVSSQLIGAAVYRQQWEKFSPCFNTNMKISRRSMKLYIAEDLAILHCYSRVENILQQHQSMPWCRTTLCVQKQDGQWLIAHQHISLPVNLSSGNVIMIDEIPQLKRVG